MDYLVVWHAHKSRAGMISLALVSCGSKHLKPSGYEGRAGWWPSSSAGWQQQGYTQDSEAWCHSSWTAGMHTSAHRGVPRAFAQLCTPTRAACHSVLPACCPGLMDGTPHPQACCNERVGPIRYQAQEAGSGSNWQSSMRTDYQVAGQLRGACRRAPLSGPAAGSWPACVRRTQMQQP